MSRPLIRERNAEEEGERFTSKDLTRKQILLYIFEDFFKGFYIFLALFIDGLFVTYLYMEPFLDGISAHVTLVLGFPFFKIYLLILSFFLDAMLIYLEIKYYGKLFGEEAIKRRYTKKSGK
ncbi:MAG: hypothetical protein M1476_07360 [Candidatus Thermoplasmatota archaeon]|nr:hypothetical protein [Candidatus Thermoplasmatota archaeon]